MVLERYVMSLPVRGLVGRHTCSGLLHRMAHRRLAGPAMQRSEFPPPCPPSPSAPPSSASSAGRGAATWCSGPCRRPAMVGSHAVFPAAALCVALADSGLPCSVIHTCGWSSCDCMALLGALPLAYLCTHNRLCSLLNAPRQAPAGTWAATVARSPASVCHPRMAWRPAPSARAGSSCQAQWEAR